MSTHMMIYVSSTDVATEMLNDGQFTYDILSEVAYSLESRREKFVNRLIKTAVEETDTELLEFLREIHDQYAKDVK